MKRDRQMDASRSRPMRVAIMGTRGVPATYGGFETFAEELGARLVDRGHAVVVYSRSHVVPAGIRRHRGMSIRRLPAIRHKYLDTVSHTALSVLDGLTKRFDVVLMCNNANAPFAWVPRVGGAQVVLNVDGLEWLRQKWGVAGRAYYRWCSRLAPRLPVRLVTDAIGIRDFYRSERGVTTTFIPYGTDGRRIAAGTALAGLGLEQDRYILYVSRLEPENHATTVIDAYRLAGGGEALGMPLVVVGDAPYASAYRDEIEQLARATSGVILAGAIYGDGYVELQSNAALYVQATEVGGTHPALVESMGRGAAILANDVPEHREVLGTAGAYYRKNDVADLAAGLNELAHSAEKRARLAAAARQRGLTTYGWEAITDEYVNLFRTALSER